jgi:hypothetical protein
MPESKNNLCFVIMPFGDRSADPLHFEKLETIYTQFIKRTVESIKLPRLAGERLKCHRADKEFGSGDIIDHIIESLINAQIVIADLTGKNANVFYELGVRHAVSNATILIAEGTHHIPFDVHTQRTIVYDYTPDGMIRFQANLRKSISQIISAPEKIDNPVRRWLYHRESAKLLSKHAPPGFDVIQSLLIEVSSVRDEIRSQRSELGSLLQAITQGPQSVPLSRLEGIWYAVETNSTYCMKIIKGELRVAYSYGDTGSITSHFYNCRVIGNVLACRFEWFQDASLKGFVFLRFNEPDRLEGGWCLAGELPYMVEDMAESSIAKSPANEFAMALSPESPGLTGIAMERSSQKRFPKWAEDYFEQCALASNSRSRRK